MRRRWLVPVAACGLALVPVSAAAHVHLVTATPPSGTSAPAPPGRIVLSFAEALDPARSSAALVGPDAHPTPWPATVSGGTLAVQPPALPAGAWLLRWSVTVADGDHETGDYRFTVASPRPAAAPATGPGAGGPPGPVERGGRLLLLGLGVPLAGLLLLGGAVLTADPGRRASAGSRLAGLRSWLWALELLSLCGFAAGLVVAGGTGMLAGSVTGPPLLAAIGVTAALGAAVFDGGALRAGEAASVPTTVLGRALSIVLLAALAALVEAPGGDLAGTVAAVLALSALGAVAGSAISAVATPGAPAQRRAELLRLLPRAVVGLALLAAAAALHPDPMTAGAAVAGGIAAALLLLRGGAGTGLLGRPTRPAPALHAVTLAGAVAPRFERGRAAAAPPVPPRSAGHPLPAGTPLHRRLSGHFVDLSRLLETLGWSAFTGYVRIEDGAVLGVLVLVDGVVAAARLEGEESATGPDAVRLLGRGVARGRALLDVVGLEAETARAVVDLLSAPTLFSGLRARMVNLEGILEDLCECGRDGTVVVSSADDTGVILVRGGGVHGAYTRRLPRLHETPAVVTAIAGDEAALVEVRVAPRRPEEVEAEAEVEVAAVPVASVADEDGGPLWDRYHEAGRRRV
jgi:hypothetical protein